jgi:hypothetical protein
MFTTTKPAYTEAAHTIPTYRVSFVYYPAATVAAVLDGDSIDVAAHAIKGELTVTAQREDVLEATHAAFKRPGFELGRIDDVVPLVG